MSLARLWVRLPFVKFEPSGLELAPTGGGYIIASNHAARFYAFAPMLITRRNPAILVAEIVWLVLPVGALLWLLGAIPVVRFSHKYRRMARLRAIRILEEGGVVMLYPEGKRSAHGSIGRFWPGAVRMSLETRMPIVPVGVYVGWWRGRRLVRIACGEPLHPEQFLEPSAESEMLVALRRRISLLSGLPLQEEK